MYLLKFLRDGAPQEFRRIIFMAALSGCANAYLVAQINNIASRSAADKAPSSWLVLLYLLTFAIFYFTNRSALSTANVAIERLLRDLRISLLDQIRRSDLLTLESLGRGDLVTRLVQDTNHLSQTFPMIVSTVGQLVMMAFCLVYLASLSLVALAIMLTLMATGLAGGYFLRKSLDDDMREVAHQQGQLLDSLGHLLNGFKEIKVNRKKNDALYAAFRHIAQTVERVAVSIGVASIFLNQFATVFMYLFLGVISFVLPQFLHGFSDTVFQVTAASLFCVGPLAVAVMMTPHIVKANLGLEQIFTLERQLAAHSAFGTPPVGAPESSRPYDSFKTIRYQAICFSYKDSGHRPLFTIGPISLDINRGELLFLVGGNGSGKSTTLKVLTGLYPPDSGTIQIDGLAVDGPAVADMRELFSVIFADFHLFDRLYGLEGVEAERVQALIGRMELTSKVKFEDGQFSNLNLSTGQRKRLALIAALLEDRPIYIFDEWAADQDAHFRAVFYDEILPDLRARGKTVIAVTHDDRFWGVADRVIKLDLGQVASEPELVHA